MGHGPRSQPLDLANIFKISKNKPLKDVTKAYKSLLSKRTHDKKNPGNPTTPTESERFVNKRADEDIWSPKFLSRAASSRLSKTPTPKSRPMSRNGSRRSCKTPSSLSRNSSRKSAAEIASSSIKKMMSKRGSSASLSRNKTTLDISEPELTNHTSSPGNDAGTKGSSEHISGISLSSNLSHRSTTPIIFSQTTSRRKPPDVETKLHCTLEDLCFGCKKKIRITRDVIKDPGVIVQQEEVLKIEVKPGWRKGTKITFEGVGDEKPGFLPADVIFVIEEKKHPLYTRDSDDLELCVEIPLVDALTGCSIPIPLLGGENKALAFENTIIYHGYEKVIKGQGMPNAKKNGSRGDLRVKFLIDFPKNLTAEQRREVACILQYSGQ
ncbi:DnaJ-like protein subfamily B member 4 [Vigna unguiculata]|uniref:DnaJ-like protein subfamily B member 4 n=1 Tax=Vigna unguiculata TaxID=3917 RepID=A0A4D6KGM9_VIGUN|nr:DnaJ-like protein subfamily B member 4 [Vigna unguiculata]